MLQTIVISDYIHVQGKLVRALDSGEIVVCTGSRQFVGTPISPMSMQEPRSNAAVNSESAAA